MFAWLRMSHWSHRFTDNLLILIMKQEVVKFSPNDHNICGNAPLGHAIQTSCT